ncbi:MAG: metallophosphoesterase family protein [Chloroflexi bacterium]|nr:metallophosphoesterase family protein [Chloroflexota bacterium]
MRTLIVSDIHSNLDALDAVLADAISNGGIDGVWCLGDIVGYGPEPMACLERLWGLGALSIMGNHDGGAVGLVSLATFNPAAKAASLWTAGQLTEEARRYLEGLPQTLTEGPFTLAHGTPSDPMWEYLTSYSQAEAALGVIGTSALLVGHSHLPFVCQEGLRMELGAAHGQRIAVDGLRLAINPGSVGQPRDGDPRAAYAVYDDITATVELRRVAYDVSLTQRKMADAGLPESLINRLSVGH